MAHWQSHNPTISYQRFHRDMMPLVRTIPEILYHQDKIVKLLAEAVRGLRKESYEAILDIIWVLSRELRQEFASSFLPHLFVPLISKIDLRSDTSDMMEMVFRTLMLMFRFLHVYMIKELHTYFVPYERLLAHGNIYVRGFAAESFAFLLQKMNREEYKKEEKMRRDLGERYDHVDEEDAMADMEHDLQKNVDQSKTTQPNPSSSNMLLEFLDFIFHHLYEKNSESLYDGIALLFFHAIKGVVGNFRTGVSHFIGALLQKHAESLEERFTSEIDSNVSTYLRRKQHLSALFLLLKKVLKKLMSYAQSREVAQPLWKALHGHFDQCKAFLSAIQTNSKKSRTSESSTHQLFAASQKHLIGFTVTLLNSPSKVDEHSLADMLQYWLSNEVIHQLDEETFVLLLKIIETLSSRFDGAQLRSQHAIFSKVPWQNMELYKNPKPLYHLFISLANVQGIRNSLFSHDDIIRFTTPHLIDPHSAYTDASLSFLLMYSQQALFSIPSNIYEFLQRSVREEFRRLYSGDAHHKNIAPPHSRSRLIGCLSFLNKIGSRDQQDKLSKLFEEHTSTLLRFMIESNTTNLESGQDTILSFPRSHGQQESESYKSLDQDQLVAATYIRALELVQCTSAASTVVGLFLKFGSHHVLVQNSHGYFDTCSRKLGQSMEAFLKSIHLSVDKLCESHVLQKNLSSYNDQTRLSMIRMLIHAGFSDESEKKILKHMLKAEEHEQNFHTMRDRQSEIQRIISLISSREFSQQFIRIVLVWQLGSMWIKLNLSEMNAQVLEAICENHSTTFWNVVYSHMGHCFDLFRHERDYDMEHSSEMTPVIYDNKQNNPALAIENRINFSAYVKFFALPPHFFDLSHTVQSIPHIQHITVTQYFHYLWKCFISKTSLIEEHSIEFLRLFDSFHEYAFNNLEQERVKRIGEKTFVGQFLYDFVVAFQHVDVAQLKRYETFLYSLICTTHAELQIATTQVLKRLGDEWLVPHIELVMRVLKSRSSTKPLEKFKISAIPENHRVPLMRFLTRATLPLLDTKKSQEKAKRRQHESIVRFLGKCHDTPVIAAIIEELFAPLISMKDDGTSFDISPVEFIIDHRMELKRALSITGVILKHSFSSSAFLQYFDEIMRLIAGPLSLRREHYADLLSKKIGDDEMKDSDHTSTASAEEQLQIDQEEQDSKSETGDDDEDSNDISYLAQEAHRLSMVAFRRYPEAQYSRSLLTFHMDNSMFIFSELLPVFPHSLPSLARVSFAFFSHSSLCGALLYKDFLDCYLNALEKSQGETSNLLLAALDSMVSMQDEVVGEYTASLFFKCHSSENTVGQLLLEKYVDRIMTVLYALGSRSADVVIAQCTSIAKGLLPYFTNKTPADAVLFFFGVTIPKHATMEDEEVVLVLDLFKQFVPLASAEVQVKFISYISKLLLNATDGSIRLAVCDVFDQIASTVPAIAPVSALLRMFEARERSKISSEDVSKQLAAIQSIKTEKYSDLTDIQWMPVACSLLYKMGKSKVEVKESCVSAISHILTEIPNSSTADLVEEVVLKIVSSKQIVSACVHMKLLKTITEIHPRFACIKGKLSTFYDLLASTSSKSKAAAITEYKINFSTWYKKNIECSSVVLNVFLPIFLKLLGVSGGKLSAVSQACHDAIQTMSASVDKSTYKDMYKKLLKQLTSKDNAENDHLISLVVSMTERFTGQQGSTSSAMASFFMDHVVKSLRACVFAKKGHMNLPRIELAKLIVEIVSTFAEKDQKRNIINKIIRDLVAKLNSKENLQRKRSREVLISVVKLLREAQFLSMAMKNASHILVDGFQRDVFLTTSFELLSMAVQEDANIPIDSSIKVLLPTLFRDIKKEAEKISTQGKVDKKQDYNFGTVYECVRIIGRGMVVEKSMEQVVSHVHSLMKNVHQKDILMRFETVYHQLVSGLAQNKTLTDKFLVHYCITKFDECSLYNAEFKVSQRNNKKPMKKAKYSHLEILPEPERRGYITADTQQSALVTSADHDIFLVRFLVNLIARGLKQSNSLISQSRGFAMLFDSLVKYASGRDEDLALSSLQCLLSMRKQKLPIAVNNQNKILDVVLTLLRSSGVDTHSENWQVLFNALHYFMHKVKFQFNEAYQSLILDVLQLELTSQRDENANAFLLVKGMIDSKTMLPQMYDLAKSCRTSLITTIRPEIQSLCVHIFKKFLIYYPMEPNVLQEHLNFIFQNIMNTSLSTEARLGLGEMIHTIITRFPIEYLQQKAEYLVCPVAVQICNEQNTQCKEKLQEALLALLDRVDAAAFSVVMKLVRKWLKSDKLALVGFQVMRIASKVNNGAVLQKYMIDPKFNLWKKILIKLSSFPSSVESIQVLPDQDTAISLEILGILECMFRQMYVKPAETVSLWPVIKIFLVHPSVHVRFEALQVVKAFFSKYSKKSEVMREEEELVSLGLLLLENLMSKNLEDSMSHLVRIIFLQVFKSLFKYHSKKISALDASDESDTEISFDDMLSGASVSTLMKRLRTFVMQSQRTDDSTVIKRMRMKSMLHLFETLVEEHQSEIVPCIGFMTPTLYLLFEDAQDKDSELAVQTEDCINSMKGTLEDYFTKQYTLGRAYILNRRASRKDAVVSEYMTNQKEFAKKQLLKRRRTKESRKETRKRIKLQ
eukprot:CAMPEP_0117435838 /NCGR_PEP_ID=MMETSP0759-20121206/691_1 /TAXON_ID=63605 /ORGANISM="Percolomonas cosmopolitus, Strain WS" /LENGTH=2622 /DNA_ID=CAMNT_0005227405 /DNA_START=406 /DNA_END=8274 /DNA_ORIENTATION=+